MHARRATSGILLAALASASPTRARAEEPPQLPPAEPAEERPSRVEIEPPASRPPWSGREAIWSGVGLIILGTATLIVVAPAVCSQLRANPVPGQPTPPNPATTCLEATIGGGAGAGGLGVILLAVGELQRATYKQWLRTHPMFAGLSVTPGPRGPVLGWSIDF